jgi:CheY-like chemotaxis protein
VGEGGELTIEVGSAELGAHEAAEAGVAAGRYALLVVRDDGQGMEATTRTRVFEPFFTTKPTGEGTGLGLSTAHGIVTQTGGAITVESAPGEGATFRILLPRADGDEVPAPPPDPAPGAAGGGTVLVVEDEELVRAVIAEMLESHGYRVLSATGAQEGEALFEEHGCDVLVTDVVMPGESGVDLARRLSARRPGLRILYVSGYTREAFPGAAALEPGSAFLQKPFTVEALAQALAELLAAPAAAASPAP